ncbi:hypothetical protein ACP70R_037303 [Stipagrostis hirtigluma subsp. patula]
MEGSMDWAELPVDILHSISRSVADPKDFVSFRAVCPQWRGHVSRTAHARFHPWILKSDNVGNSGDVLFYSLSSRKYHEIHVPALKDKRTRLAGFGAGHLVGIDRDDDLSAVLVNPLTGESTALPCLPGVFHGNLTYGFATDPEINGEEDLFVVVYNWWPNRHVRTNAAMWRRGGDASWVTMPSERFWARMPQHRRCLATEAPHVLEERELLAAAAAAPGIDIGVAGGGMAALAPGVDGAHLIEHEGQVRFMFRLEENGFPVDVPAAVAPGELLRPQVTFALQGMVGDNWEVIDWANVPELHDKIILQSQDSSCYVLPASDDDVVGLSKNSIYFFALQRLEEGEGYCLCKWDLLEQVATIMKQIPGDWTWNAGRWFLPTFKY